MSLQSMSKFRQFLNQAPFWQRYPVWVILIFLSSLILRVLIHRLSKGGWDWDKYEHSLIFSILFGIHAAWGPRKDVGKNDNGEH